MKTLGKILQMMITLVSLAALVYYFQVPLLTGLARLELQYFPCARPIKYSLGNFDERFDISQKTFLEAIRSAEDIWEKPTDRDLFVYDPAGKLKIHLIYDDRQAATKKLQALGIIVNNDQATYNKVKATYEALVASNKRKLDELDTRIAAFQIQNDAYSAEVEKWNKQGGATPKAYEHLLEEKAALQAEIAAIKKLQNNFNAEVDNINATVEVLNRLARTLNITAEQYNKIGQEHGGEFTEGEYTSGPEGMAINIYQFDDQAKLKRVLAHELGHALGLDHVEESKAIMYRLNNGVNEKLTAADLTLVKAHCKI